MNRAAIIRVLTLALVLTTYSLPSRVAAGSPENLEGLRATKILIEGLGKGAEEERISRKSLEDQVLVTLRSKAPSLRYDPAVIPFLYVNLTLSLGGETYAGTIALEFARPVEILAGVHRFGDSPSKRVWTIATVWRSAYTIQGARGQAAEQVRRMLDLMLEEFLADYFRGNP
jgi:hypothetical protein